MVMEVLTYQKLAAASDQLPADVVKTWQPPQAIKALLEFQELADQSVSVSVAELPEDAAPSTREDYEGLSWLPLGDHHALTLAWLKKHYNKVGNMLHAQPPDDDRVLDFQKMAADLRKVAAELERAVSSTIITITEKGGLVFECAACKKPIVRNLEAMKRGGTAKCFTQDCLAEYRLLQGDAGEPTVTPILVPFVCTGCKERIELHHRKVKQGNTFSCSSCGTRHLIGPQGWHYSALSSAHAVAPTANP